MKNLRQNPLTSITGIKVIQSEDYIGGLHNMPGQDLLKFYLEDNSWLAIRPSGTEPKLKIYFVGVDATEKLAKTKIDKMIKELKTIMNI